MIKDEILNASLKDLEGIPGIVTEVERYAIHDGPGIRTVVFLKGCPLRCRWCCNPETQNAHTEITFFEDKCNSCGRCMEDCPHKALAMSEKGLLLIDRSICRKNCFGKVEQFPCTKRCYPQAIRAVGESRTVLNVYEEISRDVSFYETTGGGMTISGGEPMFQPEFTYALLRYCRENWIDTAMETSGSGLLQDYKVMLPYLDVLFVDFKSLDANKYMGWSDYNISGPLNVIENLSKLVLDAGTKLYLRVPVIPGFNSSEEEIYQIGRFIRDKCNGIQGVELLPYHKLGRGKYKSLGLEYQLADLIPPTDEQMDKYTEILLNLGIKIYQF